MTTMKQIEQRKIKTIKPGIIYISPLKKMINLNVISDAEIVKYVEKGYISKDRFDWKAYDTTKKATPEKVEEPEPEKVEEIISEEPIEEEPIKEEEKSVEETKEIPQEMEQKPKRKGKNSK